MPYANHHRRHSIVGRDLGIARSPAPPFAPISIRDDLLFQLHCECYTHVHLHHPFTGNIAKLRPLVQLLPSWCARGAAAPRLHCTT
nr:unnamed protein product [Digitaria exilis]